MLSITTGHPPDIEEAFYPSSSDGLKIFGCVHPVKDPRGVVLLTHGLGEHSGRYGHVIHFLHERELAVVRFDLRGHGRSEGNRGHTSSYEDLLNDVSMMSEIARKRFPNVPLVAYGHSLGGNIIANWLMRRKAEASSIIGAVLTSPWLELTHRPSHLKVGIIRSLSWIWPSLLIPASFRPRKLTRHPAAIDCYEHDPLIHRRASVRLVSDAYFAGLWALENAAQCETPVLALHGTADSVTSPEGTRVFCERAPHADLLLFPDLVHEPHNEPEWRSVVGEIRDWILKRIDSACEPAVRPTVQTINS